MSIDARAPRVKNRAPAAIQITAEQLLREAQERQEVAFRAPKQRVEDFEELDEYRGRKRKEFEERIRRTRGNIKEWTAYASWEANQGQYDRSRSVYERALDVDPRNVRLWLSYTEMELKSRNVQHARNHFDRAVTLLPRIDQLWYKYVYLEELLQNVPGARQVFERWMKWEPDDKAWQAYIKLEERYGELDRSSAIYERWVSVRPDPRVWVKWAKFEEERGNLEKCREVFQTALEYFGDDEQQVETAQAVFAAFAKMETRLKEYERARVIYKFALSRLPRSKSASLYAAYTKFEKQHGDRTGVEATVLGKRRIQYEEEILQDPHNYDVWFDYVKLEEDAFRSESSPEGEAAAMNRVREVYERAVAQVPPASEKRYWRRYIFLWLNYALFEEIETKDTARARQIYKTAVQLVPHKQFTFAKLWTMFARFEIRQMDLQTARKILGTAIGMSPKEALFKGYIQLELELREFDRVRTLYEKYLEYDPTNCSAWIKFAELESTLGDLSRTRAIFELAASQPALDMPELLWKAYIDLEVEEGERQRARALYERLLERSGHVKVWIAYALFEGARLGGGDDEDEDGGGDDEEKDNGDPEKARAVFERGYKDLKGKEWTDRVALLEAWKSYEQEHGTPQEVAHVQSLMPQATKRRRKINDAGDMEEYWDMVFADDEKKANPAGFKFLQMAHAWKQTQAAGGTAASGITGLPSFPGFVKSTEASPTLRNGDSDGRSEEEPNGSDEDEDEASDHQ
ncbi:TPR-like protein [Cantharellus anzutake]|uniref:TPR-like protein n=1 Tax=Cantharellus anzutake TaxID=1750568 RepID=UPI001904BC66|nr:TPR-like protein [Cantharellus anzutake]KAF8341219.1 TPR-like protein [Cantharellus anzutake]